MVLGVNSFTDAVTGEATVRTVGEETPMTTPKQKPQVGDYLFSTLSLSFSIIVKNVQYKFNRLILNFGLSFFVRLLYYAKLLPNSFSK